jgi:hypothetical protein
MRKGDVDPLKKILPSWMIKGGFIDDVKDKLAVMESEIKVFIFNISLLIDCVYTFVYLYMFM